MAVKTITVPVRGDGKGDNVLAHAAALALRDGAHVKVLHCRPQPEQLLPYGVPVPGFLVDQLKESASKLADAEEKSLREEFIQLISTLGLEQRGPTKGVATASFQEAIGRQIDVIKAHGRLADVIAVAKPDRSRNLGSNTLKAALFTSGRPVLMCPPRKEAPSALAQHVAIAWNGSIEATRAVGLAADVISGAQKVSVISAGEELHGATATDLIDYLALKGSNAELQRFSPRGNIGRALLAKAKAVGADMLIMGAYRESHERETLLGGNTQVVVDEAKMPILFVH